ncbi:TPA: YscB family type III secretion system chaperone, partial [Pseudomonas aeruginosa]|nr:YscB family type III secretion system chaperone [Pseudomonas aeruginosa]
ERALAAQVGLLEALAPELEPLPRGLPPQVPVWRP